MNNKISGDLKAESLVHTPQKPSFKSISQEEAQSSHNSRKNDAQGQDLIPKMEIKPSSHNLAEKKQKSADDKSLTDLNNPKLQNNFADDLCLQNKSQSNVNDNIFFSSEIKSAHKLNQAEQTPPHNYELEKTVKKTPDQPSHDQNFFLCKDYTFKKENRTDSIGSVIIHPRVNCTDFRDSNEVFSLNQNHQIKQNLSSNMFPGHFSKNNNYAMELSFSPGGETYLKNQKFTRSNFEHAMNKTDPMINKSERFTPVDNSKFSKSNGI